MKNKTTFKVGDTILYVGAEDEIHGEIADVAEVFKDSDGEWFVVFNLHRDGMEWGAPAKDCRLVKSLKAA